MQPARYDLELYQGDEFELVVRLRLVDGTPEDVTQKIGRSQVRGAAEDEDAMAEFVVTTQADGQVRLYLSSEQATSLVPGSAVWDLQLRNADGTGVRTRLAGRVRVKPQVTR